MAQDAKQSSTTKPRDPEDRKIKTDEEQRREKAHDKTLADSFPTSDPPSSIPDPGEEDNLEKTA